MSPSATAGRADGLPDAPILRVGILAEVIAKAGPMSLIQPVRTVRAYSHGVVKRQQRSCEGYGR
jgi:hypothetical protein